MKLLRHLPNALTCCNLICGSIGIISVTLGHARINETITFVVAACIFDFLDGFVARLLKVSSPIGKELDSLADMVSFGVFPAIVTYVVLSSAIDAPHAYRFTPLFFIVFSALRLAKFNIDERQSDSFIGLPTPAAALLMTGLWLLPEPLASWVSDPTVLVCITLIVSFLLVAPMELFALKFKNFSWTDNKIRFTFILLAVLLLAWWQAGAIPLIILLYIAISLVSRVLRVS
jgi:CDP-diacylglycerol--serine O-phosphatidyltransferase